MDDNQFWTMIEKAWRSLSGFEEPRKKLAEGELPEEEAEELAQRSCIEFVPALRTMLEQVPKEVLLQFDRILERKLYDLDRPDIHEYTDGSDDGFLYARGFIVAAGREYYEAVSRDPSRAMMDLECEDLCYLPFHVYSAKFGEMPRSGISRETGGNKAAWLEAGE